MAVRSLILREATEKDLPPLITLLNKVWAQLDVPFKADLKSIRRLSKRGLRVVVLWLDGEMVAALGAHHVETDRGPGFKVIPFVVDQNRPDRLKLLDAISLYALNIGQSEGRSIVASESDKRVPGGVYGRDFLAMDAHDDGVGHIQQIGYAPDMMARILERHPEWQLP